MPTTTLVRYMGTKRQIVHRVVPVVRDARRRGAVLDLFCGMGSVPVGLADIAPVATNDALAFTAAFARARFLPGLRIPVSAVLTRLQPLYRAHLSWLSSRFRAALRLENAAVEGDRRALISYMTTFEHAANNQGTRRRAQSAKNARDHRHHQMCSLYYAAGYFSLRQAIQIDSIRAAIDGAQVEADPDWLLAAWLAAAATVINAPGHTAQFLKPSTAESAHRIRRTWRRDVWQLFGDRLSDLQPVGTRPWRLSNRVFVGDALQLVAGARPTNVLTVYADPPYTRDQYSRYYHVYEALYRYEFPEIAGVGRTPIERFQTRFSLKTQVVSAFRDLLGALRAWDVRIILSYPTDGLLADAGWSIDDLAVEQGFRITRHISFPNEHSTLGASNGSNTKEATENLYVCV